MKATSGLACKISGFDAPKKISAAPEQTWIDGHPHLRAAWMVGIGVGAALFVREAVRTVR